MIRGGGGGPTLMPTEIWGKAGRAAARTRDANMFRISFLE